MKVKMLIGATFVLVGITGSVSAANDAALTHMTLCQDSWVEWSKSTPKAFEAFRGRFMGQFKHDGNNPYWLPKENVSVLGMHVMQAFPDSVGMGVGFSLNVDAPYDKARAALEKAIGKKLAHCEASDGMKSCELEVAPQRSIMVMAEDNSKDRQTLVGCYYFYEK